MSPKTKNILFPILTVVLAGFFVFTIISAWREPTKSPPQDNVPAPLNVGTSTQWKAGALGIGTTTVELTIPGQFAASIFYDTENTDWYVNPAGPTVLKGNVGIGTTTPTSRLEINAGMDSQTRIITTPAGQTGTYTINWDVLQICQFGTCCAPWIDCDGDGKTYMSRNDCDEGCEVCWVGSENFTFHPDGKDQDCNGHVDEKLVTIKTCISETVSWPVHGGWLEAACRRYCQSLNYGYERYECSGPFIGHTWMHRNVDFNTCIVGDPRLVSHTPGCHFRAGDWIRCVCSRYK